MYTYFGKELSSVLMNNTNFILNLIYYSSKALKISSNLCLTKPLR